MKRTNHLSFIYRKVVKHSYLLLLIPSFYSVAEERPGLLLNGAISAAHHDNVLNNVDANADTSFTLSPDAKYLGLIGKHKVLFSYKGKLANYSKESKLNYNEHSLAAGARLDHSYKINTEFKLSFDKKNEEPGSTNSSTINLTNFNKFETKSALARLYYGQASSTGQIVVEYKMSDREYTNNQQSFRDVDQVQLNATFFYRIAPKTRLLFQASTADYNYNDQTFSNGLTLNQSSKQNFYLTGVEWEATAKSTGIFKIGYQDKDYNNIRFNDISGLSYNLDMIWKPNTYSRIKLGAVRQTTESAQLNVGGFINTSYSIDVSHKITARTSLSARYILNNDNIVSSSKRTDKRNSISLSAKHSLRKWLNIGIKYKYQEKSSNIELFNYNSNTIELTLETAFE